MNPTIERLRRLLAYFDNGAAAVRATLAFLENDPTARAPRVNGKAWGRAAEIHALGMDAERRELVTGERGNRGGKSKAAGYGATRAKRRAESARVLALFDRETPRTIAEAGAPSVGLVTLARWGYLKRTRSGFIRTAKPFHVDDRASAQ